MKDSLRVLMLVHRFADNSPYSLYVHEQAMALRDRGHDVTVFALVTTTPGQRFLRPAAYRVARETPERAEIDGIHVFYPRYLSLGNPGERLLGGRLEALAARDLAQRQHAERPFDLIHAHLLTMTGHAGLLLGDRLGLPVALTAHGTDVFRNFTRPPIRRNRWIVREADALMAVSTPLSSLLAPYRPGPIHLVENGIDLSLVPQGTGAGSGRVITVGTLKPRKGMFTTLEAFQGLMADFPSATLEIIGDGPQREALAAAIADRGLGDRVHLLGPLPHEEVLARMGQSDAFALPSYAEGYGIVYIEAMAAGCVAVGSLGEGIADTIRDGENGLLVPAVDAPALEAALRRILSGGPDIEALRQRGQRDARALTWARNAELTEAVYRDMLAGNTEGRTSHGK